MTSIIAFEKNIFNLRDKSLQYAFSEAYFYYHLRRTSTTTFNLKRIFYLTCT